MPRLDRRQRRDESKMRGAICLLVVANHGKSELHMLRLLSINHLVSQVMPCYLRHQTATTAMSA
jgi:hypothetical protein